MTAAIKARPFAEIPPSVIVRDFSGDDAESFNTHDIEKLMQISEQQDAVVFGMGVTVNSDIAGVLKEILQVSATLVLDADALNTIAAFPELWQYKKHNNIIITPHPTEAFRLAQSFGISEFTAVPRHKQAQYLAEKMQCIVVLKGDKTVIASPDGRIWVNQCGSYALAKGGSGDILSGIIGAFAAKPGNLSLHEIAALGVFVHAVAADRAAQSRSAFDINRLPDAVREYINAETIN